MIWQFWPRISVWQQLRGGWFYKARHILSDTQAPTTLECPMSFYIYLFSLSAWTLKMTKASSVFCCHVAVQLRKRQAALVAHLRESLSFHDSHEATLYREKERQESLWPWLLPFLLSVSSLLIFRIGIIDWHSFLNWFQMLTASTSGPKWYRATFPQVCCADC